MLGTGLPKRMVIQTRAQKRKCFSRKIKRRMKRRNQERQQCHIRLRPPRTMDAAIAESLVVKAVHAKRLRMRVIQAKDGAYASKLDKLRAAMCFRC